MLTNQRYLRNNIRTILNVLEYYEAHPEKQMAVMFIDAEKAFDNVCWDFMLEQLRNMLGDVDFVKMIQAIYSKQKAKILVSGELTESINIFRGTSQGCPLPIIIYNNLRNFK